MKTIILCLLFFIFGFLISDLAPRRVIETHPVESTSTGLRGVMIVTKSECEPFFLRNTTAMISNKDWKRFCPND